MLGGGYFNPLTGYMNVADAISVSENMKTTDGLFWPIPILKYFKRCIFILKMRNELHFVILM